MGRARQHADQPSLLNSVFTTQALSTVAVVAQRALDQRLYRSWAVGDFIGPWQAELKAQGVRWAAQEPIGLLTMPAEYLGDLRN